MKFKVNNNSFVIFWKLNQIFFDNIQRLLNTNIQIKSSEFEYNIQFYFNI